MKEIKCFICKQTISREELEDSSSFMLAIPPNDEVLTRVYCHNRHANVKKEYDDLPLDDDNKTKTETHTDLVKKCFGNDHLRK